MIVDDMQINRMILSSMLASNGVLSDQVESGWECLERCREKSYDLILMDHRMPEMDGVDTFVKLRELFEARGKEIPVICHTTAEGQQNINLYKAAGFSDVLIKPIEPALLSKVLLTYLPVDDEDEGKEAASEEDISGQTQQEPEVDDSDLDEIDRLPLWMKTVPYIDLVAGINNCGSADEYIEALQIFHSSINSKAAELEKLFYDEDWSLLGLRVHSLKSMARLIGARKLGEIAAAMEGAVKEQEYAFIKNAMPSFLETYRVLDGVLLPIEKEAEVRNLKQSKAQSNEDTPVMQVEEDHSRCILLVHTSHGIVQKGLETQLEARNFHVISIPDEPDQIITHRFEADTIIYVPDMTDKSHISLTTNFIGEICQDDAKVFCLTGNAADIEYAMAAGGAQRVSKCYQRPVDIAEFLKDMERFAWLEHEYHRKKMIYVVDDDPEYLSVIEKWLSADYQVSCFNSGEGILEGLKAAMPDLILMDYEMPVMDGCALMRNIRTTEGTEKIPIVFLTGKNDRDHVFHILEYKPDGYLLKSSRKDALLDALHRFFSEQLFRMTL